MKKRTCIVCGKTLADLNPSATRCFAHNLRYPRYVWVPVTKCTSYVAGDMHALRAVGLGEFADPGRERYQEMAFTKHLIYPPFEWEEDINGI